MHITRPDRHYDVLVVGGGMVGASFAVLLENALADTAASMLVVEAVASETQQPSFDARSTALSWSTRDIYHAAALWTPLSRVVTPIREIQVSDKGHFGSALLNHREHGKEALGYVVENRHLGRLLQDKLQQSQSISYLLPARIETIRPRAEGMALTVASEDARHEITADLVVLADGGRSPICGQLGIEQSRKQYGQHALIANIAFTEPHNNIAYERFTESGPLAVLPLEAYGNRHRGALVWTLPETDSEALLQLTDAEILPQLMEHFGHRLGEITAIGQRFCYPLSLSVAREQIRPGLVLLGNVAHTLHPVAGQGFNLALRDVARLVDTLSAAVAAAEPFGAMAVLQRYMQQQEFDQRQAIGFTDRMTRLFSSSAGSRVLARKFGMLSIELLPSVRREFARQAMGLRL